MINLAQQSNANYTNAADLQKFWLEVIAPNYFSLDDINNYKSGIFGYINEVMATTTEDAFNAMSSARREFYPVTAQFASSLYTMASMQQISVPLTVPAHCKCALIIPQKEIIDNSTVSNGVYECTIDSCLKIFADSLQFMLDYPIKIISKKTDHWSHTIHYDVKTTNSLSTGSTARYLANKILTENGVTYVAIFIDAIRQVEMTQVSQILVRDSLLQTSIMDVDFAGNLANFEVFYVENSGDAEVQLKKVPINSAVPSVPFVFYEYINANKIRLTFKYNGTFVPKYNSEIICRVYTSEGADGMFSSYDGDLICSSDSEAYPYNSTMTILGKVNGASVGGKNAPGLEELRSSVVRSFATNNTVTSDADLQLRFNEASDSLDGVRVMFRKKRDDPLVRLFGAYSLIKDTSGNIIPTNTLDVEVNKTAISSDSGHSRIMLKPGSIFTYKGDTFSGTVLKDSTGKARTIMDLGQIEDEYTFTNPFLIGINLDPNVVGYYLNSLDSVYSINYSYVNDGSPIQFIASNFKMSRNAMLGHNYYKLSIKLAAASELDSSLNIELPDPDADDYEIRAKMNGRVAKSEFVYDETLERGYVKVTIEYDTDVEDDKYEYIQASNTLVLDGMSTTGYKMNFEVGETFIANDLLATKLVTDKGNLRVVADIGMILHDNGYYVPFVIEDYDPELNAFVLNAYMSTTDQIDTKGQIEFDHGIFDDSGEEQVRPLKMKDFIIELNVLFNNDGANIANKYTHFAGLNGFTLTNSYTTTEDIPAFFIEDLQFIRSVIDYKPGSTASDYLISITEVPMVDAHWALDSARLSDFVQQYRKLDQYMQEVFYDLENNFSIDTKFYNTCGKARFYTVGNSQSALIPLNNVRLSMHFGVKLSATYASESFVANFREYVKAYIENTDNIGTVAQDIYILNLVGELKKNFAEIEYLEYYGFNGDGINGKGYDHMAQKIIGPGLNDYIDNYIPEFINIGTAYDKSGVPYPDIIVDIL